MPLPTLFHTRVPVYATTPFPGVMDAFQTLANEERLLHPKSNGAWMTQSPPHLADIATANALMVKAQDVKPEREWKWGFGSEFIPFNSETAFAQIRLAV